MPPRPKPGRKPATDTPPTKRKAQNRAAQRAFRERRAARVNELEDKLKEVATDTQSRDQEYKDQIVQLTRNNTELAQDNAQYRLKLDALQRELEAAIQLNQSRRHVGVDVMPVVTKVEMTQVASPAPSSSNDAPCGADCSCQDFIDKALCDRPDVQTTFVDSAPSIPLPKRARRPAEISELLGCGSCKKDGECGCYDSVFMAASSAAPIQKRPGSPPSDSPQKRNRTIDYLADLETDFTTSYPPRASTRIRRGKPSSMMHMPDPCGFCSDGTPCVCAEMANAMDMEDSDSDSEGHERDMKLAPMLGGYGMLSPPSSLAGDSVPLRRMIGLDRPIQLYPPSNMRAEEPISVAKSNTPGSGCKPGGCDQCKSDPMSTLFCQSVATRMRSGSGSKSAAKGDAGGGCCGGNAGGGGCCKDIESVPLPPRRRKSTLQATVPVVGPADERTYIPCSAAYMALSRHRAFDEAAADLGALVRPLVIQSADGSCPQVEVNSVRDVLKMLDRRFGRD